VYYDVYEKLLKIFENFSLSKFLLLKKLGNFSEITLEIKMTDGLWPAVRVGSLEQLSAFHGYAAIRKSGLNVCKGSGFGHSL
jgi:hypothetical protein